MEPPVFDAQMPQARNGSARARMRSAYAIECAAPDAVAEEWRVAHAADAAQAGASPFLSPSWMRAWLAATRAQPVLLRAAMAGRADALGWLCRAPDTGGRRVFALNECGDGVRDVPCIEHNGLVGWAGETGELHGLARHVLAARRMDGPLAGWDELRLGGVPRAWAGAFAAAGAWVSVRAEQPVFVADLASLRDRGDALATMGAETRRQIRRARALYARDGAVTIERVLAPAERDAALACLVALHQARWTTAGQPGAFASPVFRDFVERLVAGGVPGGEVELLRVCAAGRTIAVLLNLVAGGAVANYVAGVSMETDNRLKPGLVAHAMAMELHMAEGRGSYDLLAGESRYKRSLASRKGDLVWLTVRPPGVPALLAAARGMLGRFKRAALTMRSLNQAGLAQGTGRRA
jgi:CelD/BcsL family acetyltransferase involved in cellulose biosynthesis